jgi:DNA repair protein RadD
LVRGLRDPIEVFRDAEARQALLSRLPEGKRTELGTDLGVAPASLGELEYARGSARESALLRFVGLAEASARPTAQAMAVTATPGYGLFEHQRTVVGSVIRRLNEPTRCVVLHLPTGAGKTRCAMHVLAHHFLDRESAVVVWLAYSQELLEQAASEFEVAWGYLGNREIEVLRYWGGNRSSELASAADTLVVASLSKMYSSLRSNPDDILGLADHTTLTVMDEAHQSIAATYKDLLELLRWKRQDALLLGLTATPGRTWADIEADRALSDFFGGQKVTLDIPGYDNPVAYLIEEGYLARPTFVTLNVSGGWSLSDEDRRSLASSLDVPPAILESLASSEQRNLRIVAAVEELVTRHRRVLVFAATVGHARLLSGVLAARGHHARAVTGETSPVERERAIRDFRSNAGRPMVLTNYGVLTTGFDAPATSAIVIARPTRSLVLYSQMVGRALRGPRAGGNERCEVVTVVDPELPGFGDISKAFTNWEDVWE